MKETQESITKWADDTFGKTTIMRSVTRANEEMAELLKHLSIDPIHPKAPEEIADIFIVLYRAASYLKTDIHKEIDRKMFTNRNRKWKLDGAGCAQHIEEKK